VQTLTNISKNTQNWNQYQAGTSIVMTAEIKDFEVIRGSSGIS